MTKFQKLFLLLLGLLVAMLVFGRLSTAVSTWTQMYDDNGNMMLSAGGIIFDIALPVKPACDITTRGTFTAEFGAGGVADALYFCQKNALDLYVWKAVVS